MRNPLLLVSAVVLAVLALRSWTGCTDEPAPWSTVSETPFARGVPHGKGVPIQATTCWLAADGFHVAWVHEGQDGDTLVVDGKPRHTFPEIRAAWGHPDSDVMTTSGGVRLFVSPDGKHVAHPAKTAEGMTIAVDGKPGPSFDRVWPPRFCRDGEVAFAGRRGTEWYVVVRGKTHGPYERLASGGWGGGWPLLAVHPAGEHVAWIDGTRRRRSQTLYVDGQARDHASRIRYPRYLPDGTLLYVRWDHERQETRFVRGAKKGPPFRQIDYPYTDPTGRHVAYGAMLADDSWALVLDGDVQTHRSPDPIGLVFSPDGTRVAYGVRDEQGSRRFVVDGELLPHEDAGFLAFSPAGDRFAYTIRVDGKDLPANDPDRTYSVVVDGVPGPPATHVWRPVFSPDGKRVAYRISQKGRWALVLDGEIQSWGGVGDPHFSPDSRHVAVIERSSSACRVFVDGIPGPAYDWIPDVQGLASPYASSDRLTYVGIRDGTAYVVEQR